MTFYLPRLAVYLSNEYPLPLGFADYWWDRILRGFEWNQVYKEFGFNQALMAKAFWELPADQGSAPWQWHLDLDPTISSGSPARYFAALIELYAKYDDLIREEWGRLTPAVRHEFIAEALKEVTAVSQSVSLRRALWQARGKAAVTAFGTPFGMMYYKWLRPYYYIAGIEDPPTKLEPLKPLVFLGKGRGLAHGNLIRIFADAEKLLVDVSKNDEVSAWAFLPRPKRDLSGLNNHALGRAMDINPETNPHILGRKATLLDEVLESLGIQDGYSKPFLEEKFSGRTEAQAIILYTKMSVVSAAIQNLLKEHLDDWEKLANEANRLDKQVKASRSDAALKVVRDAAHGALDRKPYPQVAKLVKGLGGIARARVARDKGVFTISAQIFMAFKNAGAKLELESKSGTEYKSAKDPMHFESPGPRPENKRYLARDPVSFAAWFRENR